MMGLFFPTICFSKFPKYNYSFPEVPDATSELTSRHWRAEFCLPYSKYEYNQLETVRHLTRSDLPYNEAIMGEKRHQTSQDSCSLPVRINDSSLLKYIKESNKICKTPEKCLLTVGDLPD